jgi:hypothetical protein
MSNDNLGADYLATESKSESQWWRLSSIHKNNIFIFQTISLTTTTLFNIACYYIGKMCWIMGFNPLNIGRGWMCVLSNSRVELHGILLVDTHIWWMGVRCFGVLFGISHDKGPHIGIGAIVKRFIRHNQLDLNGPKL